MGDDVSCAVLPVAERLAQRCDVKPQTAFLYRDVGPDLSHQFPFPNDFIRAGHQRDQNVECSRASSTGAPSFVSSRPLATRLKGPKEITFVARAAGSIIIASTRSSPPDLLHSMSTIGAAP